MVDIISSMFCKFLEIINKCSFEYSYDTPLRADFWNLVLSLPLYKIPIISFSHYPIFMQFHCIVFASDGLQISSLTVDTLYISSNCITFPSLKTVYKYIFLDHMLLQNKDKYFGM